MATLKDAKKTIKELSQLLGENDLTEIEMEQDGLRIRVSRGGGMVQAQAPAPAAPAAPPPAPETSAEAAPAPAAASHPGAVKSPMVGTVYVAPEPGADAFVSVGDSVKKGQTVLIVEAMKVMNQISAHKNGTIKEILINDADPVEFDQPLLIIE